MNNELKKLSDLISFFKQLPVFIEFGIVSSEVTIGNKKRVFKSDMQSLTIEIVDKMNDVLELFNDSFLSTEDVAMLSNLYYYWYNQTFEDYIKEKDVD